MSAEGSARSAALGPVGSASMVDGRTENRAAYVEYSSVCEVLDAGFGGFW